MLHFNHIGFSPNPVIVILNIFYFALYLFTFKLHSVIKELGINLQCLSHSFSLQYRQRFQ